MSDCDATAVNCGDSVAKLSRTIKTEVTKDRYAGFSVMQVDVSDLDHV